VNGRVGELRCRYRLVGDRPPVAATTRRLDTLVREEVAPALAAALERELGDDPAVYVLRHVTTTAAWHQAQTGSDGALGRGLGERLAGSVLRALANPGDPGNLVRFDDQADYVAYFLGDLLDGVAWDRWYYGAFVHLRPLGTAGAAGKVLREYRDQLAPILAGLRRRDQLERLLAVLDQRTLRLLWPHRADGTATPDRARPLLEAAFRLADRLDLWAGQRPDPGPLLEAYLAGRPRPASWRDRADLTAAVADAVRLLAGRGHLRRLPGARIDAEASLERALAELDWLDTGLLRRELVELLMAGTDQDRGLPNRPTGGPTARQRQLLLDLAAVARGDGPRLDPDRLDSPVNALRLLAALVAAFPRWSDDAIAGGLLGHLLAAADRLARSRAPGLAVDRLGRGDAAGALLTLPPDERAMAAPSFAVLARLGAAGTEAAALLTGAGRLAWPAGPAAEGIQTGCAGTYLMLRAAMDVRLPALAASVGYPDAGTVLLALALRWAGEAGSSHDRADPGLAVLDGHDGAVPLQTLRQQWAATPPERHRRWQETLGAALGQPPPPDPAEHEEALAALRHGQLGLPEADAALGCTAAALLRHWARWLRGFSTSSVPYLLDNFVRRPGRIVPLDDDLLVELEPRPLDPVLELAGYTDELDLRGLLGRQRLRFRMEGS
jgi:hypothetical protein